MNKLCQCSVMGLFFFLPIPPRSYPKTWRHSYFGVYLTCRVLTINRPHLHFQTRFLVFTCVLQSCSLSVSVARAYPTFFRQAASLKGTRIFPLSLAHEFTLRAPLLSIFVFLSECTEVPPQSAHSPLSLYFNSYTLFGRYSPIGKVSSFSFFRFWSLNLYSVVFSLKRRLTLDRLIFMKVQG